MKTYRFKYTVKGETSLSNNTIMLARQIRSDSSIKNIVLNGYVVDIDNVIKVYGKVTDSTLRRSAKCSFSNEKYTH